MPTIRFGEWLPDLADLRNPGLLTATNVFPSASSYLPVADLTEESTSALDARPRGAIQSRDKDLNVLQYAGDATKLYQNVDGTWTDRSKSGGYSTADDENWEFAQWKNKVIATNFSDDPQVITLGGAAFADLTTAFKARHVARIRDFVVFANTSDATDGAVPSRVRWSGFNDETDYTVSAATLSDFQDLKQAPVERIFGGEFGVVLQKDATWRMTFVGSSGGLVVVFQFDEVLPGIGPIAPGACAQDGNIVYFLSDRGFFALVNGTEARPIGANKIDQTVLNDIDADHVLRISAAVDPSSKRVWWAYPGTGHTGGRPNKIVVYDRVLDRWSQISDDVELLWQGGSIGFTLDGLDNLGTDIDDAAVFPVSWDSRRYVGGAPTIAAFNENRRLAFFDGGSNMAATLTTGEMELHDGRRTRLDALRPLIDGGAVTAEIGTRDRQTDAAAFGSVLTQSASGRFTSRASARYHRFRFNLTGAWTDAIGMQIDRQEARAGERRA